MVRKTKEEAEKTRVQILEAARRVFHRVGVSGANLDTVAREAGVTRGAVYHHFENKSALFFEMKEHTTRPLMDLIQGFCSAQSEKDPLCAMEQGMIALFQIITEDRSVREVFEIMLLRCEYVAEFVEILRFKAECIEVLIQERELGYREALAKGLLREGVEPRALAEDTFIFLHGLLHHWLSSGGPDQPLDEVKRKVHAHMALRRKN